MLGQRFEICRGTIFEELDHALDAKLLSLRIERFINAVADDHQGAASVNLDWLDRIGHKIRHYSQRRRVGLKQLNSCTGRFSHKHGPMPGAAPRKLAAWIQKSHKGGDESA